MGAGTRGPALFWGRRAAGVTVTHEPFKLRDPSSTLGRPIVTGRLFTQFHNFVRPTGEHVFVREHRPLVQRRGRPPSANRTRPVELRMCRKHGETEFAHYSSGADGYRWKCKRCVGEAVTRRHQKLRRTLIEEAGGACVICGYARCVISLHFHHVDPATKSFSMTVAVSKSLASFRTEAQKCVLLCANCHGEVEAGLVPSPPAGSVYGGADRLLSSAGDLGTHHSHRLDLDEHPGVD